jgi:hypothetical protein
MGDAWLESDDHNGSVRSHVIFNAIMSTATQHQLQPAEAAPKPSEAKDEEEAKPRFTLGENELEEFPIAGAFSPSRWFNRDQMLTLR